MNERETAALQVEDLTYNADGLIPCIVQDEQTREVLMMAWMNEEAVRRTISQGTTWFWSRSRQKFWHKGEESGNTQKLVELRYDCDADTLLAVVNPAGPACHTGETTCFYRSSSMANTLKATGTETSPFLLGLTAVALLVAALVKNPRKAE